MAAEVFAGIPVDDFDTARAWYEIFAGRPPNVADRANEAVWRLAESGGVHVVGDEARAGSATVTLLVDDLERYVGFIAMRGIAPESIDKLPGGGRRATVLDPAGNTIKLVESVAEETPAAG